MPGRLWVLCQRRRLYSSEPVSLRHRLRHRLLLALWQSHVGKRRVPSGSCLRSHRTGHRLVERHPVDRHLVDRVCDQLETQCRGCYRPQCTLGWQDLHRELQGLGKEDLRACPSFGRHR